MADNNWEVNPDLQKLFVNKLKPETTDQSLINYFSNYGTVTNCNCKFAKDNEGNAKGYAFVSMSDQAVVDTILENRPHTIDGQTVILRRAIPKNDPDPRAHIRTKKLFIGGLTEEATDEDISNVLEIFTPHKPESIKRMYNRDTSKFKGFAFATFHSDDIVDKLFIIRKCTIKDKAVELKKAEELGGSGGGAVGHGRGGRGGGEFGRGGARGGGGGGGGGYYQSPSYGGGSYDSYDSYDRSYNYYDQNSGYGNYESTGGYDGSYYGGVYSMGQYSSEPSGYGPSRRGGGGRGRGGSAAGGGGYRPNPY